MRQKQNSKRQIYVLWSEKILYVLSKSKHGLTIPEIVDKLAKWYPETTAVVNISNTVSAYCSKMSKLHDLTAVKEPRQRIKYGLPDPAIV